MKLTRVLLVLVLIPTFAFMAACVCACPSAQAAFSNQLELHKKASCCCPENDNHCKTDVMTIQKDIANQSESFQLEKIFKTTPFESIHVGLETHLILSQNLVLPDTFLSPSSLSISTTVLRI